MFLIVGLGNPGTEYKGTRHNIGFNVVDVLADSKHLTATSSFRTNKPLQSELLEGALHDAEVTVIKPITFMNNSGLAVKKLADSLSLSAENIIVIHDEITLDLGQVKISKGAGAGNHNGVQSIIDHVQTKDFIRVRCGIGRGDGVLSDVVLSKFRPEEKELVDRMIQKAADACVMIVREGLEKAMNQVN
ncbi:MAG: aminoacyl-tRNA hydrolase [Candidatus Roizmanbacteria bacterium]|nr:aminoacyl-tRNA hydrolase [Candidatus Roizmanbacteria bacterium]